MILSELLHKIREKIPNIAIRTTLITGYPNETEKDVEELIQFMKEVQFDRLGVFTYSQEDGTVAFDLGDTLSEKEKEQRKAYIMETQQQISLSQNEKRIGKQTKVIIERKENEHYVGRTEWDAPEIDNEIFIPFSEKYNFSIGDFAKVTITDAMEYDMVGEVIK